MSKAAPLLVVSHSAVTVPQLRKWRKLAISAGPLVVAVPESWPEGGVWQKPTAEKNRNFEIVPLKTRFAGNLGRAWLVGLKELALRVRPQAVWAEEEPFIPMAWQALKIAQGHRIPFGFFTWENQDRPFRLWQQWIRRGVLKYTKLAIAGNSQAKELLLRDGFQGRIQVLPQYGVSVPIKPRPEPKGVFTVGYAGRLVAEKGIDLLLGAAQGKKWKLLIAGTGPLNAQLKAQANKNNLQAEFLGYGDETAMKAFYKRIHLLVLPSRETPYWKEQFGRVLAEAMSHAIACIASDTGAIAEVLGEGGLVFADGDVRALAAQISRLEKRAALRKKIGLLGRRRVQKFYSEQGLNKAMLDELRYLRSAAK